MNHPPAAHARPFYAEPSPDGSGAGVLLLHGFTGSPASIVPWGRHLAEHGHAVAVPRLPGHGTSWQQMDQTRWMDWYDEAARAFDKLRANCDAVVVGGLSMGGALALRLAELRGADVTGVLLVNPGLTNADPMRHLLPVLKHVMGSTRGIVNDIKKPGVDEHGYQRTPLKATASLFAGWKEVNANLHKVTQPVLMFRSKEDHVVPASSGELVIHRVTSRDLTERILENSYHVATLDYDAPEIFAESEKFVRRVATP